jgi:glycosyltransferase involved in cell wall biosynthesis/SAM-dependent methyltransferase
MPLHVAMVVARFPPSLGGSELQAQRLAQTLVARGLRISILTQRLAPENPARETKEGVEVYRLALWAARTPWESPAFIASALRALKSLKPDASHAHMLSSPALACAAAQQLWGIPAIAKGTGVQTIGEMGAARASKLRRAKLSYLIKHLNVVVGTLSLMRREFLERGFHESQIRQIPNGVDLERFKPADPSQKAGLKRRLGVPEHLPLVLSTGRISREKGVDLLLEAWTRRPKTREALLWILGDGPDKDSLEKRRVPDVKWLGNVQNVESYLQAADLFVLPSRGEALSNSLLEAMASGLACLVTRVGGTPEVIDSGRNGLLIPSEDPACLSSSLEELLGNRSSWDALGKEARKTIEARYDLEVVARSYIQLYEELVDSSGQNERRTQETFGYQWRRYPPHLLEEEEVDFLAATQIPPELWKGKLALDAGCGMGRYTRVAARWGAQVVGVDLSLAAERAAELVPEAAFVQSSLEHLPFAPETFDIVYSLGVLHHTRNPKASFRNIARQVKQGGILSVWLYGTAGVYKDFITNPLKDDRLRLRAIAPLWWLVVKTREIFSDAVRRVTTRLPPRGLWIFCVALAGAGKLPLIKYLTFSVHSSWRVRTQQNFDWLSPPYQSHHTKEDVLGWFIEAGFQEISMAKHGMIPKVALKGKKL